MSPSSYSLKSHHVILLSKNPVLEHVLWTLGVPFYQTTLSQLKALENLDQVDEFLFICQSNSELQSIREHSIISPCLFLMSNSQQDPKDQQVIQSGYSRSVESWTCEGLPFYSGIEGIDWIGPRSKYTGNKIWAAFQGSLAYNENTLFWGLHLESIFSNYQTKTKAYFEFLPNKRLAHEEVSALSKGSIFILFRESLRYLFHKIDLPLYTLPTTPPGYAGVFMWKVDTDGADHSKLSQYVQLLNSCDIRGSFFLDMENLLESQIEAIDCQDFIQHEWNLHCSQHLVYEDATLCKIDLQKGKVQASYYLENLGDHDKINDHPEILQGHSSPYGSHPKYLSQLQSDLGFIFGSNFAYAENCWPLQLNNDHRSQDGWQIPFHPICPQSLTSARYSSQDILEYFQSLAKKQLSLGLPLAWYDHPHHPQENLPDDLLHLAQDIIQGKLTDGTKLKRMTTFEYLNWWKNIRPTLDLEICPEPIHTVNEKRFKQARKFNFRRWKQDKLRKHLFRRKYK